MKNPLKFTQTRHHGAAHEFTPQSALHRSGMPSTQFRSWFWVGPWSVAACRKVSQRQTFFRTRNTVTQSHTDIPEGIKRTPFGVGMESVTFRSATNEVFQLNAPQSGHQTVSDNSGTHTITTESMHMYSHSANEQLWPIYFMCQVKIGFSGFAVRWPSSHSHWSHHKNSKSPSNHIHLAVVWNTMPTRYLTQWDRENS